MTKGKNIYFASDFHLGIPNYEKSLEREKKLVSWLDTIKTDAAEIYLLGDLFDFWFEYKHVVPKGYVRLLGKIAELTDAGIPVHVFTGNHDMWMFDYLPQEIGIILHREPQIRKIGLKTLYIAHGDGLGPGDYGYKFIKKVFANPLCQWLFARIHPNLGIGLANFWSKRSRLAQQGTQEVYLGDEREFLVQFCHDYLKHHDHIDYFVFGHRHLPLQKLITQNSTYINLGDWIRYFSYAVFNTETGALELIQK